MKRLFNLILLLSLVLLISSCKKKDITGPEGTFTDSRDDVVYKTIKIGTQTWMAQDLAYLPAVSRSAYGSDSEPRYYVYGYEGSDINEAKATSNYQTYGALYNWEAAKSACPTGWHMPTDDEWITLEGFLGMSQEEFGDTGERGTVEGAKLKATSGWADNGNGNNESGFTALPGGIRNYGGGFEVGGEWAEYWSSTAEDDYHNWNRYLTYDISEVGRWGFAFAYGLSVRCVKD